jgi:molybdopterin synthase sulfur carrier subunit
MLTILYFAWVRETVGADEEHIAALPPGATVRDIIDLLSTRSPGHATAFENRDRLRAALDQIYVDMDALVGNARELALFPPVTGG